MEEILKTENLDFGEQPQESVTLNAGEQQVNEKTPSGSLMDKFKNVEALQKAYKNLEKEFTIKCQKIKELSDKLSSFDNAEKLAPKLDEAGLQKDLDNFLQNHPQAKQYEVEISKAVKEDSTASTENPFETALTKVLTDKILSYDALVTNEDFLSKYIYNNEQIKKTIVDKYLEDIVSNKAMPLITGFSGTGTATSPVSKPKSIFEAGKVAEAYFKN